MKKLIFFCAFIIVTTPPTQAQLLASSSQFQHTGFTQYSSYNFAHLEAGNMDQQYGLFTHDYGSQFKVHVGPVMTAAGLLTGIVGLAGMSQAIHDPQGPTVCPGKPLSPSDWKQYNTFSNVAIAGAALFTAGMIVSIAEGDFSNSGHTESGNSDGWWIFYRHHHFGHREHGHYHRGGGGHRGWRTGGGHSGLRSGGGGLHLGGGGHSGGGHSGGGGHFFIFKK